MEHHLVNPDAVRKNRTKAVIRKTPPSADNSTPSLFDTQLPSRPFAAPAEKTTISYVFGDATYPRLTGTDVLVHVVNDGAVIWGAGFGKAVRFRWPQAQSQFRKWVKLEARRLRLGEIHVCSISPKFWIVQLIAQHGYGPSTLPRIRYDSLRICLTKLADFMGTTGAVLHMPRIGCGEAGGHWGKIYPLIEETLCAHGIEVVVYALPDNRKRKGGN